MKPPNKAERKRLARKAEGEAETQATPLAIDERLQVALRHAWAELNESPHESTDPLNIEQELQLDGEDLVYAFDGHRYHFRYFDGSTSWTFVVTWNEGAKLVAGESKTVPAKPDTWGRRSPIPD